MQISKTVVVMELIITCNEVAKNVWEFPKKFFRKSFTSTDLLKWKIYKFGDRRSKYTKIYMQE